METLITDGFADDEWCDADDVALLRLAIHSMITKALNAQKDSRQRALMLEPRTLDQVRSLPLWSTRLRVVIDHTADDDEYIETFEGCLGGISWGASEFDVCIGGRGYSGEGRWINLLERPMSPRKVTIFEVMN